MLWTITAYTMWIQIALPRWRVIMLVRSCTIFYLLFAFLGVAAAEDSFDAESAAREILDGATPDEKREQLVEASVPHAAAVVRAMTKDLPDDQAEEYRRIPWIWRVAIAAGKKNDADILRHLLDASLPQNDQPLADWQAVVIGGGIINGISQVGPSPAERFSELMADDFGDRCWPRWQRTIKLAAEMVDDAETPTGTRYDALRILGATNWDDHGKLIAKYLARDVDGELQMGAVSAAGDLEDDEAARALLDHMEGLNEGNRTMAIDALIARHPSMLRAAIRDKRVSEDYLSAEQKEKLKQKAIRNQ